MSKDKTSVIFTGDIGFDRYMARRWEDEKLLDEKTLAFFRSADHVAANVEGALIDAVDDGSRGVFFHAMNPAATKVLKNMHADIWCVGNNHTMDAGREGVVSTRKIAQDMEAVGLNVHLRELTWKEYINTLELDPDELEDEEREQLDWTWDMYYGEVAITGDWNTLTLFTGDREKDGTLNYGKWNMTELADAVREFIGAKEEDRPAAESTMLQLMSRNSVFIPVCFEKREAISHLGVIKGMAPN